MAPRLVDMAGLRGTSVLVVFAHPDDESLACGGTLARLADAGSRVMSAPLSHTEPELARSWPEIRLK